ncbi:MAG TPA: DNA-directed RNA polymerase subunit alpha [Planctomycetota bacterium]|nr:DNA-directed RNA polymerase subunit alpha [Planctomycetota bacterium]
MRIRWRDFEIPNSVVCEESSRTNDYGKFIVEPFERGFGVTVGNSLRRILLSSLEGSAIVSAKIEGVQHEFSSMTGVYEDVTEVILNLKNVLVGLRSGDSAEIRIRKATKGEVRAGDIEHGPEVEIINPDEHIATLTQDIPFNVDLVVRKGRGYNTAEENSEGDNEIGVIWMDSTFSPVRRVRYKTENTRVGQRTNYDRLIMEIWTNGTIAPDMALVEASKILRRHLNPFVQYSEFGIDRQAGEGLQIEESSVPRIEDDELRDKVELPVNSLELSARALNCLESEGIKSIGDLVRRSEPELLKLRNFGKTTLDEIKLRLTDMGLSLGMDVPAVESK